MTPETQDPVQEMLDKVKAAVDPFGIAESNWAVQKAWLQHPEKVPEALSRLGTEWWNVHLHAMQRLSGVSEADAIPAVESDERFNDPAWTENALADILKEYYLLYTRNMVDAYYDTPDMPDRQRNRASFWAKQWTNALAPANFFWTNPVAMRKFLDSGGQSLADGIKNLSDDAAKGDVSMVDDVGFHVGGNLANTPGKVVFRNYLLELIQYTPTTEKVHAVPLVIVAPWINKYYVLDLTPEHSLVRHLVEQGFTVFVTSWKNPTPEMAEVTFDDYMLKGVLEAVNVAREITGAPQVHLTGYCIGGTAVAALMAWLNREPMRKSSLPVAHWTLFASLVDFANPGEIEVFIDDGIIDMLDQKMSEEGFLDSKALMSTFRMLRSNSLVWRYIVHNYLYGETPPPIPVLYWNTDGTRLPRAMHTFYLREFYLHNKLAQKNGITLGDRQIDLGRIQQPLYIVGTEEDHITPWKQTFRICDLVDGTVRYALSSSGHILGIVNPPAKSAKRKYWVGAAEGESDPQTWLARQEMHPGSWWGDWTKWLGEHCGALVEPPQVGSKQYPVLAAAPGKYVLEH